MAATISNDVATILKTDPALAFARNHGLYDACVKGDETELILFGAGWLGRRTLEGLRSIGISPTAFVDNNPSLWGTQIDGLTVYSRARALDKWGRTGVFVVTIFHGTPVRQQLIEEGFRTVVPSPYLFWKYPGTFLPFGGISLPEDTLDDSGRVQAASEIWADEQSLSVYRTQLQWRMSLDYGVLPPASPTEETYFPPEVLSVADELFVDCGAFDGDSIQAFFEQRAGMNAAAIAIEPDPSNYTALRARMEGLGVSVDIRNVGASSAKGHFLFEASGTAGSTLTESGTMLVPCEPIDSIVGSRKVTYLKMDIEGAELDALKGAAGVIQRDRPVLAICLYHKPQDLWEIPLSVRSLLPEYKLLLRAHSEECWELVLYAIPADRYRP